MTGVAMLLLLLLPACAAYEMEGRVVEGNLPQAVNVGKSDPRLALDPLPGTTIQLVIDPDGMDPKLIGPALSGDDGRFVIPIDETGAGFLNYDLRVIARRTGHAPVDAQLRMPRKGKRLLIVMPPGPDRDIKLEPDPIDETLRMGRPFLDP